MNVNDRKIKPQLSRHELILDRFKTILKSSSTEILTNKSDEIVLNNSIFERKIDDRISNAVNNSGIKKYLNEMINTSTTPRHSNTYGIDSNNSSNNKLDQIEIIKAKYSMKISNNYNTCSAQNKNELFCNNSQGNLRSIYTHKPENSFVNIIQSNMLDNSKNLEIESIKSKYSTNSSINAASKESQYILNVSKTSKIDDILSKYKQKENITINNNIENRAEDNEANGQSNEISKVNFNTNIMDSNMLDRINSIEDKLNKIQNTLPDLEKTAKKENVMNRVKEIVNKSDVQIDIVRNEINETIENNIKQIKYLKEKNINKIEEHGKKIHKDDNNTFQLINEIIENVTGKLFRQNEIPQIKETEDEIKLMPNKAKIFKLKASIPNTVKKKIQTFEEFISSDTESK